MKFSGYILYFTVVELTGSRTQAIATRDTGSRSMKDVGGIRPALLIQKPMKSKSRWFDVFGVAVKINFS